MIGKRFAPGLATLALGWALAVAAGLPPAAHAQPLDAAAASPAIAPALAPVPLAAGVAPLPAPAPRPRRMGPVLDRIERAWSAPASGLDERVARTRRAADDSGIASLDALGRALVFGGDDLGGAGRRAEAAVALAPDLPAAHAALARARFEAGSFAAAASTAVAALHAFERSFDGSLWLAATASVLLFLTLAAGTAVYLAARGLTVAPHAAHDLGDRVEASMPAFSRAALLAAIVLLPAALGEGVAGALLGLLVIALWQSRRAHQIALVAAALLFVAAIHPLADYAGAQLARIGSDPAVRAVVTAEGGAIDPVGAARLARAGSGGGDPFADYALAQWTKRSGDLAAADARFTELVAANGADPVVLASAASAKIALGDPKAAVDLYRRAIDVESSAFLWFNLSQAHGRAIDVEQHDRALAAAQSLDPAAVSELTVRLANSDGAFVADLPLPLARLRARLAARGADAAAAQLRAPLAPGAIGRSLGVAIAAFSAAALLGVALQSRVDTSTRCVDCGARLCRHCGTARASAQPGSEVARCEECRRRSADARVGTAWDARPGAGSVLIARLRSAVGCLLPGLAGASARRAGIGVVAALAAAGALVFGLGADAVVPDPATVGDAGAILFGAVTALCVAVYAVLVGLVFWLERRRRA